MAADRDGEKFTSNLCRCCVWPRHRHSICALLAADYPTRGSCCVKLWIPELRKARETKDETVDAISRRASKKDSVGEVS